MMDTPKNGALLTMESVAVLLGTSRAGVQTLITNGKLPALIENKPRRVLIPIGAVQKLVLADLDLQRKCKERLRALYEAVGVEMPEANPLREAADALLDAQMVELAKQHDAENEEARHEKTLESLERMLPEISEGEAHD